MARPLRLFVHISSISAFLLGSLPFSDGIKALEPLHVILQVKKTGNACWHKTNVAFRHGCNNNNALTIGGPVQRDLQRDTATKVLPFDEMKPFALRNRGLFAIAALTIPRGGGTTPSGFSASKSLLDMALSASMVSFTMWTVLGCNIRLSLLPQRKNRSAKWEVEGSTSAVVSIQQEMSSQLRQHRLEKWISLKAHFFPCIFLLVTACLHSKSLPWQEDIWKHGPSARAVGLNFGYWASEIVMDTALDECAALQFLHPTLALSMMVQLILIVVLTTRTERTLSLAILPPGHMVLWLKATETLMATALAKLMDHPLWIGIAILASGFMAVMASSGLLAPLPPQVPIVGAVSYFLVTFAASTAYQVIQNHATAMPIMSNVKFFRAGLGCLAMLLFQTPPSWILFDFVNFAMFFGLKIATDTIALSAIKNY